MKSTDPTAATRPATRGSRGRAMGSARRAAGAAIALTGALFGGCTHTLQRSHVTPAALETLDGASPFLKAHLRSGGVYVLADWRAESGVIVGHGSLLDSNRVEIETGEFRLPADSIALFETNVVRPSGASTALTVMTGITAAVAGYCLANPKACFGSCPTFYVDDAGGTRVLQAEGFSASIAPALEATDVDMLYHARPANRDFRIRVTNEALETHVIRHMDVLALPRPADGRVFASTAGTFLGATGLAPPVRCRAPEGDCTAALRAVDGHERWSAADSTDLATREHIELEFAPPAAGDAGLIITARQTLLTTYLIYQALAYMGSDAGRWLASLETGGEPARALAAGVGRLLGVIDVLVQDESGEWLPVGSAGETGPLASDSWIVPLPPAAAARRVRLRMSRGLWRIDHVALATISGKIEPQRLRPGEALREGVPDAAALAALLDATATLVTLPGDAYDVTYRLPPEPERYELFLESRGYYLEWMRQEWLAEEDRGKALRMVMDPAGMLRELAPAYKRGEAGMEEIFWGSRYERR